MIFKQRTLLKQNSIENYKIANKAYYQFYVKKLLNT